MLHNIGCVAIAVLIMAIGKSGRLIIEIDPKVKERLHKAVKMSGKTMKEWFEEKIVQDYPEAIDDPTYVSKLDKD
jgi:hypothetical protein